MIRVFIGYDPNETVAYHVLAHSIISRSSLPVTIIPVMLSQLKDSYWRVRDQRQSTDFSYSRFLVPHLCKYEDDAIFMDCDMLCRTDISEIFKEVDPDAAISVVKHDYVPATARKFLNQEQTKYRRKNWSSMIVFNNGKCKALTPEKISLASGMELHQFQWLEDSQIHALPKEWNHLVGELEPNPDAKLVHFTLGTPCFKGYEHCEYAEEWFREFEAMTHYAEKSSIYIKE